MSGSIFFASKSVSKRRSRNAEFAPFLAGVHCHASNRVSCRLEGLPAPASCAAVHDNACTCICRGAAASEVYATYCIGCCTRCTVLLTCGWCKNSMWQAF